MKERKWNEKKRSDNEHDIDTSEHKTKDGKNNREMKVWRIRYF